MLRLAVPHSGGENAPVSGQNPTAGTVGLIDGNTGANQSNSNRNSASRNSVAMLTSSTSTSAVMAGSHMAASGSESTVYVLGSLGLSIFVRP